MYRSIRMELLRDTCPTLVARFEAPPIPAATAGAAAVAATKTPTPKKPKTPRSWRERSPSQHAITGFMRQRKPEVGAAGGEVGSAGGEVGAAGGEGFDAATEAAVAAEAVALTPPPFTPSGARPASPAALVDCSSPFSVGSDGSEELMASGLFPIARGTRRPLASSTAAAAVAAVAAAAAIHEEHEEANEWEHQSLEEEGETQRVTYVAIHEEYEEANEWEHRSLAEEEEEKERVTSACASPAPSRRQPIEMIDLVTPPCVSVRRTGTPSSKRGLFCGVDATAGAGAIVHAGATAATATADVVAAATCSPGPLVHHVRAAAAAAPNSPRGDASGRSVLPSALLASPAKRKVSVAAATAAGSGRRSSLTPLPFTSPTKKLRQTSAAVSTPNASGGGPRQVSIKDFLSPRKAPETPAKAAPGTGHSLVLVSDDSEEDL
jgi:hypothetical protein